MTPYPSNEEIEKRIDERSTVHHQEGFFDYGDDDCPAEVNLERIKCFISQTRLSDLDAIIEKVEGMKTEHVDPSDPKQWGDEYTKQERWRTEEHNAVVNRVLSYLTSLKDQK